MASQQQPQQQTQQAGAAPEQRQIERAAPRGAASLWREPSVGGPFSLMRRISDEMDRVFDSFFGGLGPWGVTTPWARLGETTWWPQIDVSHRDNKLIVQADVPGLTKDDVSVEVRDDELCISGERRSESERREGGYYRTERSSGSFCRTVPLPEGAKAETASATFENGVLRVEIEAPAPQGRGRRIEIREAKPH